MGMGEPFRLFSFSRKAAVNPRKEVGPRRMWHFLRIRWELIDFIYNNRESPVRGVIFPRQAQPRTQGHLQEEEKEEIQSRNLGCEPGNSCPLCADLKGPNTFHSLFALYGWAVGIAPRLRAQCLLH